MNKENLEECVARFVELEKKVRDAATELCSALEKAVYDDIGYEVRCRLGDGGTWRITALGEFEDDEDGDAVLDQIYGYLERRCPQLCVIARTEY
jgi:hypothetical protein